MSGLKMMVAGAGALGRHHARILSSMDNVDLVAVADPCEDVGRAVAAAHGTAWIADFREAIDQIDAVSVVVPTCLHVEVAAEFLSRGIPALVEKPLAGSAADASRLVQLAAENAAILQVGHVERFNPAMVSARKRSGPPKYIRAERMSPFPFRSTDIGVVHDLLIHDIDLVLDLVRSEVREVQAFGVSLMSSLEDIVNARLTFDNGCIVDLTASRLHPVAKREMQIWSGIGCVNVDFQNRSVTSYAPGACLRFGRSPVELAGEPGADVEQLRQDVFGRFIQIEEPNIPETDALTDELAEFVSCVRDGQTPSCGGTQALAALEVADRILDAVATHSWGTSYQLRDVA
ncbi:MAG: Gfo/Idh/MocA family oxidoreductase [Planctomycetaceae bacterium]